MEKMRLKDVLLGGMTANGFKMGTTLTLGWFWSRIGGCSILYRGAGMDNIDFGNILAVAAMNATEISVPDYIRHNIDTAYFYVVRRANGCGEQENTLSAAVRVAINHDGELESQRPNGIFTAKAEQIAGGRIQLLWCYCPIGQGSKPIVFRVYFDNRTGEIDYLNPMAAISYAGGKSYCYLTCALEAGTYLFAVRAEDGDGIENPSLAEICGEVICNSPSAIEILSVQNY